MSKVYLTAIALLSLYAASLRADSCGPPPAPQVPDVCGVTLFGVGGRFDVPAGKPYAYAEIFGSQRVQLWRGDRKIAETISDGDGEFAFQPVPEGEYTPSRPRPTKELGFSGACRCWQGVRAMPEASVCVPR